jgi:sn-glycerol 3-phosphate transport system permease protein
VGYQNPLGEPLSAFLSVALVGALKDAGLYMLYYLAGLKAIPHEVLEAALVDGAGPWTRFFRVTLPLLSPTTFFVGVMAALGALRHADHIFVLTKGGPAGATDHLLYRVYTLGFEYFDFPQAGAMTLVLLTALTLLALLALPRLERGVHYD